MFLVPTILSRLHSASWGERNCVAAAILFFVSSCTSPPQPPDPASQSAPQCPGTIKLLDQPLTEHANTPFAQLSPERPKAHRTVLQLDFDTPASLAVSWPRAAAVVTPSPEGTGKALAVTPRPKARPPAVLVPVSPSTYYRVRRRVQGPSHVVDLVVLETEVQPKNDRINHASDLRRAMSDAPQAGSHARLSTLVGQHRFASAEASPNFHSDELVIFTHQHTHSLVLMFESTTNGTSSIYFDDISVEELQPTWDQRLSLVAAHYGLSHQQASTEPQAMGQFLSLPRASTVVGAAEDAFTQRRGLLAPTPSQFAWRIPAIAKGSKLAFNAAVVPQSPSHKGVELVLEGNGASLTTFQLEADTRTRWHTQVIDLSDYAGSNFELRLRVQSTRDPAIAVVANPIIWCDAPQPPPDVFLIAIDTLRADRLSAYGHPRATSPHIDALAQDGILFENAYAQSNWTPESFASLFTSSYSGQHGVTERLSVLHENTMAKVLADAGYDSHAIAYKLLLYDMGFERGFDTYFNVPKFHLDPGYAVRAPMNLARATQWLAATEGRQRFLFLHFNDPHQPFNHEDPWLSEHTPSSVLDKHGLQLPINVLHNKVWVGAKATGCSSCAPSGRFPPWFKSIMDTLYDGETAYVDHHVGAFLEELKNQGRYDDALIIVVSDHGEGLADHEHFVGHGFHHLYEEQIRVPLIIKPPTSTHLPTNVRVASPVELVDVLPTMLEVLALPAAASAQGKSLLPHIKSKEPARQNNTYAISENLGAKALAVRGPRYKYILRYKSQPKEMVYDLQEDPREQRNIVGRPKIETFLHEARRRAAQHIFASHPGKFVLVVGSTAAELTHTPEVRVELIFGAQRRTSKSSLRLQPQDGHLIWLAKIASKKLAALESLTLKTTQGDQLVPPSLPWPAGRSALEAGVTGGQLTMYVSDNTPVLPQEKKPGLGGEALEALQALGYIE